MCPSFLTVLGVCATNTVTAGEIPSGGRQSGKVKLSRLTCGMLDTDLCSDSSGQLQEVQADLSG